MIKFNTAKHFCLTILVCSLFFWQLCYSADKIDKNCQYGRETIVAVKITPDLHEVYYVTSQGRQVSILKDLKNVLDIQELTARDISNTIIEVYAYKNKIDLEKYSENSEYFKLFFIPLNREVLPDDIGLNKDWIFTHMYMGYDLTKKNPYASGKKEMYGLINTKTKDRKAVTLSNIAEKIMSKCQLKWTDFPNEYYPW